MGDNASEERAMSTLRRQDLLCQHGTRLGSCSICQPRRAHEAVEAYTGTNGEQLEAARPRLLRVARLNGIGPDEAEDVAQETFLEAWRRLERLREPERLSAWLDGICRNICRRRLHAQATSPTTSELSESLSESLDEEGADLCDPLAIDPVEELERQDLQALLDRALGYLSESARELIELCYLAEQPQREVADQLKMSLGALEVKLHRARRQLHQVLHRELRDDAQAFGLFLSEEASMGWQETRHWCFLCGKRRVRGIVERQPGDRAVMRLRCPACSPRYDLDLVNTGAVPAVGPIHSFRPAVKRWMQAGAEYYQACLTQRRCPTCHSPVQIQLVDRRRLVPPYSRYDALPLGVYAHVDCPTCGPGVCEAYIPALLHTAIRDFLLRPRVRYEPAACTTYAGLDAITLRLVDLSSAEALAIVADPQTLQVMDTRQEQSALL
jgi:RNA polymerase sigma factor (sigma-70 family)